MANQQLQAIGVHGQESREDVLQFRRADGGGTGRTYEFCHKHRSHFCPCVYPTLYKDPTAATAEWDAAEEERKP